MNAPANQIRSTYFVDDVRFPFCKGCSHTQVLRRLNDALVKLQLPPENVVLVTDIGCIGLADGLFNEVHTVHTTHGRSTAFASGLALADTVLADGRSQFVVLIGDGGAMIGLQHLVHAAMLNVNMTVLICNNFVYGMTGGQGSGLTPECFITATTPRGNIVPPADLAGILAHSHAPFVARAAINDPELPHTLERALSFRGFAAVEILELCTEYAVPKNELTGKSLSDVAQKNGWELGILADDPDRLSFERRVDLIETSHHDPAVAPGRTFEAIVLERPVNLVIGGSAGERVQSSATALCQTAVDGGLFVTQKNDNPVTQGSGFSLSEVWLSPEPIGYTGIEVPDIIVAASEDGWQELVRRGTVGAITRSTLVVVDGSISATIAEGDILRPALRRTVGPAQAAMAATLLACRHRRILSEATVREIAQRRLGDKAAAFEALLLNPVPA